MRHLWFALLLFLAVCVALPPAIGWAMNECQLNLGQAAVDACFRNAERGKLIHLAILGTGLAAAIGLHMARSKLVWLGLAALALGPWLAMWI